MKIPSDKLRWVQVSLGILILVILAFLVHTPPSRASTPADHLSRGLPQETLTP